MAVRDSQVPSITREQMQEVDRLMVEMYGIQIIQMIRARDATTGEIYKPCIKASATMIFALPKRSLLEQKARSVVGSLYLADIGVPNVLYKELGIEVEPMFIHDTIIKLHDLQGEMHS